MKILYALQGTGNGHLARATEIVPLLRKLGEVDVLISGIQSDINPPFDVKYKFFGLSFIFGKNGGVDFLKTVLRSNIFRLFRDIYRLPVKNYDLVISDFEPVSAWACKLRNVQCIGLSHQNAVLHPKAHRPAKTDWLGKLILKYYSPATIKYGFHFSSLNEMNFMPVIRSAIRKSKPQNKGHYTVYLPAYSDEEIAKILGKFKNIKWEVFSKHCKQPHKTGLIQFNAISVKGFNESFVNCTGILCTAGFETPAEAIFMGKKLCVIPMKNQYEQACNAAFLAEMGVTTITNTQEIAPTLKSWLSDDFSLHIPYSDDIEAILSELVQNHGGISRFKPRARKFDQTIQEKQVKSSPVSSRLRQKHL